MDGHHKLTHRHTTHEPRAAVPVPSVPLQTCENFLYVFKPGLTARTRRRDFSGFALAPAALRSRAGRLARTRMTPRQ